MALINSNLGPELLLTTVICLYYHDCHGYYSNNVVSMVTLVRFSGLLEYVQTVIDATRHIFLKVQNKILKYVIPLLSFFFFYC